MAIKRPNTPVVMRICKSRYGLLTFFEKRIRQKTGEKIKKQPCIFYPLCYNSFIAAA